MLLLLDAHIQCRSGAMLAKARTDANVALRRWLSTGSTVDAAPSRVDAQGSVLHEPQGRKQLVYDHHGGISSAFGGISYEAAESEECLFG
jgi:hypothetical protein